MKEITPLIKCYRRLCIYYQNGICLKDSITIDRKGFCADYLDTQKSELFRLKKKLSEQWNQETNK